MRVGVLLLAISLHAADLDRRLDALLQSAPANARAFVGIHVVNLATGKTLYRLNDDRLFVPASNMKLLTSALALTRLGPDYRFTTKLLRTPPGDLILGGSGDPSLSGRVYPYSKERPAGLALQAIEDLADRAVANGLRVVDGDIIGDDRLYPFAPYPPNWVMDDALWEYGAPVSALSVADNVVRVSIHPGSEPGDLATLALAPALEYYAIDNRVETVAAPERGKTAETRIRVSRQPGSRQVLLWGSIPVDHAPVVEELAIDDPALYAAFAMRDALERRGVAVHGNAVARHRSVSSDAEPVDGEILAVRISPPLIELLRMLEKVSQNLHAELMLREVGRVARRTGTREAGLVELAALLSEMGVKVADDARLQDGSGLSVNAQLTPRLLTRLLTYMQASKYRDAWNSLLPVGGEDGTLGKRLCCVASEAARIQAKTGTLNRAVALSGYADSTRGRLAFSILVNNFAASQREVRQWIDKIALALLE
jgi:D-alanyl-D-alanine carboxypeptidase/D-alanyl-D-alanine-endopeptidase (penicillin-binding protein 4)